MKDDKKYVNYVEPPVEPRGFLALILFRNFLDEETIEIRAMREKVVRIGQMADLLLGALETHRADIAIFQERVEQKCQRTLTDVELTTALETIASFQESAPDLGSREPSV